MTARVLILGGTGDANALAAQAAQIPTVEVITSLAGRTRQPMLATGNTRVGGFGGASGLADYLRTERIDLVIDATHPYAAQISWNAAAATAEVGVDRLMLLRSTWPRLAGDDWIEVDSCVAAAATLPDLATLPGLALRVFLTIGRQELPAFAHLQQLWFLMRSIDPPDGAIPPGEMLLERGPFSLDQERSLLQRYNIDAIVSKNSGGDATYAKILAARELQIPVVMVQRPLIPPGDCVTDVASAVSWLRQRVG
jgi:precorrin-6A/cobalt-precorrin-6A reductase